MGPSQVLTSIFRGVPFRMSDLMSVGKGGLSHDLVGKRGARFPVARQCFCYFGIASCGGKQQRPELRCFCAADRTGWVFHYRRREKLWVRIVKLGGVICSWTSGELAVFHRVGLNRTTGPLGSWGSSGPLVAQWVVHGSSMFQKWSIAWSRSGIDYSALLEPNITT